MSVLLAFPLGNRGGTLSKFLEDQELDRDIAVDSAGIGDTCGKRRPAPILREFLAELGIDVAEHRSKRLTKEIIETADLIIPMTRRQEQKILTIFPSAEGKTRLLRSFDPLSNHPDVKDPWEPMSQKMPKAYDAIYPAVLGLIRSDRLANRHLAGEVGLI